MQRLLRDVGRRVSEVRASRGYTQEQLAERLAISVKYVQRVEGGRENLTVRSLGRFAKALSVEVIAFFRAPRDRAVRLGRPRRGRPARGKPAKR